MAQRKILVSMCLYGDCIVRYDGSSVPLLDPMFLKWKEEGRLVPVCPEVCGGLPVPRTEAQRQGDSVFTRYGEDVTEAYLKGAEKALYLAGAENVCCCILKANSPSCGSKEIYDGTFSGRKISGNGFTAEFLKNAGFAVFNEYEIESAAELLAMADRSRSD